MPRSWLFKRYSASRGGQGAAWSVARLTAPWLMPPTDSEGCNDRLWSDALAEVNKLKSGFCGLTDGSVAGSRRLPNVKELQSLMDFKFIRPALPNTAGTGQCSEGDPFSNVQNPDSHYFWASTTHANVTSYAWLVDINHGEAMGRAQATPRFVWPVRDCQ